MKQKFKSYAFCLGVCAALVGALVAIGNAFGFEVNEVAITSVLTALLGVFVALGIVTKDDECNTIKSADNSCEDLEEDAQNSVFLNEGYGSDCDEDFENDGKKNDDVQN